MIKISVKSYLDYNKKRKIESRYKITMNNHYFGVNEGKIKQIILIIVNVITKFFYYTTKVSLCRILSRISY